MDPLISVIIPCYNGAWCIESLAENLKQSVPPDVEIVFVDDGSNDGSFDMFRSLMPDARCFQQENRGLGATRNRAVEEASGRYLQLLDADDTIMPGKLQAQSHTMETQGLDVIYSNWRMVVNRKNTFAYEPFVHAEAPCEIVEALLGGWWFPPNAAMVRKSAYSAVNGCDASLGNTCEDFDLWVRLAISGARFGYLHGDYSNYYRYEDRKSMSRVNRREFLEGESHIINKALKQLTDTNEDTLDRKRAAARRLHHVARNAYGMDRQWYRELFRKVKILDPSFSPPGSPAYRAIWRFLGAEPAEELALRIRNIRRRLSVSLKVI